MGVSCAVSALVGARLTSVGVPDEAVAGSRESVAQLRCCRCSSRGVHHMLNQMMLPAVLS